MIESQALQIQCHVFWIMESQAKQWKTYLHETPVIKKDYNYVWRNQNGPNMIYVMAPLHHWGMGILFLLV